MVAERCDLSVVIITRNEEEMITDCLESTISALKYAQEKGALGTYEIILSDSASTDKTVEIARKFNVKIVRLKPEWKLSAPAGRYIGSLHAKGKYVFFTDGDCTTYREWFVKALPYLLDENVAGVDGYEREHLAKDNLFYEITKYDMYKYWSRHVEVVDFVGKAIFKRETLIKVGSYNPWIKGSEERELSFRVRKLGFRLLRLPYPCVRHHSTKKSGNLRYWNVVRSMIGWSLGDGNMLKYHAKDKLFVKDIRRRYFSWRMMTNYFPIIILLELGLLNVLGIITFFSIYTSLAIIIDISFISFLLSLKFKERKSWAFVIYKYFQGIPYIIFRHGFLFIGILTRIRPVEKYPKDAKVL